MTQQTQNMIRQFFLAWSAFIFLVPLLAYIIEHGYKTDKIKIVEHADGVVVANYTGEQVPKIMSGHRVTDLYNGIHFDDLLQDSPDELRASAAVMFYDSQKCMNEYNSMQWERVAETRLPSRDRLMIARYDMHAAPRRAWYKFTPEMDLSKRFNVTKCPELVFISRKCDGLTDWCVREHKDGVDIMGCENFTDACEPSQVTHWDNRGDIVDWINVMLMQDGRPLMSPFLETYTEQADWLIRRDHTTTDNHARNVYLAQAFPAFTKGGFEVMDTPPEVHNWLNEFIDTTDEKPEFWNSESTQVSYVQNATGFHDLDQVATKRAEIANRVLKPIVEKWSGMNNLEMTAFYGVRKYTNDAILKNHVDRIDSHILSITISVRKGNPDGKPWPLEVIRYDGEHVRYDHPEGTMVLYESSKLAHGRPFKNKGGEHYGAFLHFRPAIVNFTDAKAWETIATNARQFKESKINYVMYNSMPPEEPKTYSYSKIPYGTGTQWRQKTSQTAEKRVYFTNDADVPLELHWVSPTGETVSQGVLDAQKTIEITSYPGHKFIWTKPGEKKPMPKSTVEIETGRTKYLYKI